MEQKELSQIEQFIAKAKESRHTDAILLLNEKKETIAGMTRMVFKNLENAKQPVPEDLKKTIGVFCEMVFNQCVEILANDRK